MKTICVVVATLIAGAIGVTLLILTTSGSQQDDGATVDVYSPFGLFSPGTLSALPTSASQTVLNSLGLDSIAEYQDYSLDLTKELGVSWVRIDFAFDGWGFIEPAGYLEKLRNSGIEVVGCVLPVNSFAPADMTLFQISMRDLIQRYPWIKTWQIGNEPDLVWDNPGDYPRFFFSIQQVIREACPDCRIALAGAGARWPSQDEEGWRRSLATYDRIVGEIALQAGEDRQPFDILDMHFYDFYGTEATMLGSMKEYRNLLQKHGLSDSIEFWVTECAAPTGPLTWPPGSPVQTEEEQASELVARFATMLGARVDRVAWARFYENYRYHDEDGGFFDNTGLIYNGLGSEAGAGVPAGTKKLSYKAYQTMISRLSGCTHVHVIAAGNFRFDFDDSRRPVYVLWDNGDVRPPAEVAGPVVVTTLDGKSIEMDGEDLVLVSMPVFVEKL
ncbi:MAG: hypothetical protein HZB44_08035 [Actinobacteria bacterium]|nr:hypothetical protein [Actinomycetota bacterium]